MIGFSCPPLTVKPFGEVAETVREHFQHWEIISESRHWLPDIKGEVEELLQTTDMGISIHGPYSDINLAAFDLGTRKHAIKTFLDIIEICNTMDIGPVTVHPGVIKPIQYWDPDRVPTLTREGLEVIAKEAGDSSVLIALENMPVMRGTICRTAEDMRQMLEGLKIGMCLDIGHANTTGQIQDFLELGDKIINIHVHDNNGDRDSHLPIGQGNIDFSVLRKLKNYEGNFIIEAKHPDITEAVESKLALERIH